MTTWEESNQSAIYFLDQQCRRMGSLSTRRHAYSTSAVALAHWFIQCVRSATMLAVATPGDSAPSRRRTIRRSEKSRWRRTAFRTTTVFFDVVVNKSVFEHAQNKKRSSASRACPGCTDASGIRPIIRRGDELSTNLP